jgi:ABC-2 type transport system ATP-binding protein
MPATRIFAACTAAVLLASGAATTVSAKPGHKAKDATVTNPDDGTKIAITVFTPARASASSQAPVVLHSHGWAGSRTTEIGGAIEDFLDAGFGVVSIDQRGHGETGGQAHVQDPTKETEDVKAVIDYVARLNWVAHDTDGSGSPIPNDPVLGAIGGSYGGGYQTMTALDEIDDEERTRFNALAPEITWYDLPESLAPQGVPRTAWTALLYAVGARMVPQYIHEAFVWASATGQWPDGTLYGEKVDGAPDLDSVFTRHSPIWYAERGMRIDVPVLIREGISDNLFNLNQGLHLFDRAVTPGARSQSFFIGYNGGHALPNALPPGTASGGDACSPKENFTKLTIEFFNRVFSGDNTNGLLPARYNLTSADGSRCLSTNRLGSSKPVPVDPLGTGSMIATAGLGAPVHIPIAEGALSVAGIPTLKGRMSSAVLDARAFFGLSMGTTPADALVIQNNLMPLRSAQPAQDERFEIELPGVVVDVPKGQTLFLTVSPFSDMYFGHGSRVPGGFVLSGLKVSLPRAK